MIVIDRAIISDDIASEFFVCNLAKCKGACCVEGDSGAPLEADETIVLEQIYESVAPFLTEKGRQSIAKQGSWVIDSDGDLGTPTIDGKECAYAIYDKAGVLKCGIEQAYLAGQISFQKPISCHLYPIRIEEFEHYQALNYNRWDICKPACSLGAALGVPVYKFLKVPLIRKFGGPWYQALCTAIETNFEAEQE